MDVLTGLGVIAGAAVLVWLIDLADDPPIIRDRSDTRKGPTGNWYIVQQTSPHSSTTHLSGHLTRAGAEREIAASKKYLPPRMLRGEWIIKPTSEWKGQG